MKKYAGRYAPPVTPGLVAARAATQEDANRGSARYAPGQPVEARCPYTQAWRPAVVVEPRDGWCRIEVGGELEKVTNERLRPRKGS